MADIVHAFVCVFYAARYLNIAPAVMGLYQKVSGTAPLLAALKGRFRLFTFSPFDENTTISPFHFFTFSPFHLFTISYLTKTPRFHDFTFSRFHDFAFDENTTISRFHFFTISRFHIINLPIRCYRPLSRPRWQSPHGGSSSGMGGETFQPAALES